MQNTVVFDFDGTLVADDTGLSFYRWLLSRSPWRRILVLAATPALLPLLSASTSRLFAVNMVCYLASAFKRESLFTLRASFIKEHFRDDVGVFRAGIEELEQHQREGRQVLIISGSPQWLLHGVLKHLGLNDCVLIATQCRLTGTGLILREHCFSEKKVAMARRRGFDPKHWLIGYSDSTADLPMLEQCQTRVVVNPSARKQRIFSSHFGTTLHIRRWH